MSNAARHPHRFDRPVSTAADGRTLRACSVDARCIETIVLAAPTQSRVGESALSRLRRAEATP